MCTCIMCAYAHTKRHILHMYINICGHVHVNVRTYTQTVVYIHCSFVSLQLLKDISNTYICKSHNIQSFRTPYRIL
jgi:hypothetical protein